jgi:hypothetical protein
MYSSALLSNFLQKDMRSDATASYWRCITRLTKSGVSYEKNVLPLRTTLASPGRLSNASRSMCWLAAYGPSRTAVLYEIRICMPTSHISVAWRK